MVNTAHSFCMGEISRPLIRCFCECKQKTNKTLKWAIKQRIYKYHILAFAIHVAL